MSLTHYQVFWVQQVQVTVMQTFEDVELRFEKEMPINWKYILSQNQINLTIFEKYVGWNCLSSHF